MKAREWLLLFYEHFQCLDNLHVTSYVVSSTKKIKIHGSEFKFFVSITRKLEEITIQNQE